MADRKTGSKFLRLFLLIFLLHTCVLSVSASDVVGKVLYHQDFSVVSSAVAAGVEVGANTDGGEVAVRDHALAVRGHDAYRVYAVLPDFGELPLSYTFETAFRFLPREEGNVENGYVSLLLSCTGEGFSDVLGFRIRANGDVEVENTKQQKESIGVLNESLLERMKAGETIQVVIPVKENDIRSITFIAGDETYSIHRNEDLELVPNGRLGFCVRNAYVSVDEVWVVNGTGYTEKTGVFVMDSYVNDGNMGEPDLPYAPPTGEGGLLGICFVVSGIFLVCKRKYYKWK